MREVTTPRDRETSATQRSLDLAGRRNSRLAVEQRLALGRGLGGDDVLHVGSDGLRRRLRHLIDHELNLGLRYGGRDR